MKWDEVSFLEHVDRECLEPVADAIRRIHGWAQCTYEVRWGTGPKFPAAHVVHQASNIKFIRLGADWINVVFSQIR